MAYDAGYSFQYKHPEMAISRADISLPALCNNVKTIASLVPNKKILAVVKANAYGHGLCEIAAELSRMPQYISGIAVAHVQEALAVRDSVKDLPIVCLSGFHDAQQLAAASQYQFISVIHDSAQIDLLEQETFPEHSIQVWLKYDSGMQRLGFDDASIKQAFNRLKKLSCVDAEKIVLMSHFANADQFGHPLTAAQLNRTRQMAVCLQLPFSIANSEALWTTSDVSQLGDWVRPGLALYGLSPVAGRSAAELGLKPVMDLSSRLITVKSCQAGEFIGYGSEYQVPEAMPVGIVAIGYADGYPYQHAARCVTMVQGQPCPVIGRVAMDMLAVDLRACPMAKTGDRVLLWGDGLPLEALAKCAQTISYQLVTQLGPRVLRCYQNKT